MSDQMILGVAIAVFVLMGIGLFFTVKEFRQTIHPPSERKEDD